MTEIIGVRFKSNGKVYSFAPGEFSPAEGSYVVVETARGTECGEVATRRHAVADDTLTAPLKSIVRLATEADMAILAQNRKYMEDAFRVCEERIQRRALPMRLVDVECGFDSNKLIFYFTAEARVDFRELVKDLASAFHVRIELRQIGDRDEAKLLGGLGICGREFCCKGYLSTFQPITIKMAKEQGLALNPAKISGTCGRLMCCLRYESPVYEELIQQTPKVGSTVLLPGEPPVRAYVLEANLVTGKLRVKAENSELPQIVDRGEVERLQDPARRMTKEDLRDKRDGARSLPSGKPAAQSAPNASAAPANASAPAAATRPAKPTATRPSAAKPATQRPAVQASAPKTNAPKPSVRPASATTAPVLPPISPQATPVRPALHPEFGEKTAAHTAPVDHSPMKGPKVVCHRPGSGQRQSAEGSTAEPHSPGSRRPDAVRRANARSPRANAPKPKE